MDPYYIKLVNDYWWVHPLAHGRSISEGFCHNLNDLKRLSIQWAKHKRDRDEQTERLNEDKLANLMDENRRGFSYEKLKTPS